MNNNHKGFAHLFLIVVIAVIGTGGLFYYLYQKRMVNFSKWQQRLANPNFLNTTATPPISDTVDYFVDDRKLIGFSYPKGATSIDSSSPSPIGGVGFQAYYGQWAEDEDSWSITVAGVPIYGDVEKTKQEIFDTSDLVETVTSVYTEVSETTLGRERAIHQKKELKSPKGEATFSMITETVHQNVIYTVGVGVFDKTNQEAVKEATEAYDLIRSTFRFLE